METDECKMSHRKYKRGCVVEVSWILGIIHRGHPENYRLKISPDNERDDTTLLCLIQKHVAINTEMQTD